jgi:regulator of protease activity HflC (stomatin/prohibitin superfamily)
MDCHKYFGKYSEDGATILVCEPDRGCAPYIVVPAGCIAVTFTSGAFTNYQEPGLMFCTPFTEVKYLVSKQDFVYESPINRVLTADNVNVNISVSILLKIVNNHDYVQMFCTNVS